MAEALGERTEDKVMPKLLAAGLRAWISEQGDRGKAFVHVAAVGARPALHGALVQIVHDRTEDQREWAFRAISTGTAKGALNRIREAVREAKLDASSPKRRLFLLRDIRWPTGRTITAERTAFERAGGVYATVTTEDLKTFAALDTLLGERPPGLTAWLEIRRPASQTELLEAALRDALPGQGADQGQDALPGRNGDPGDRHGPVTPARPIRPEVFVGVQLQDQAPALLTLGSLRRHIAIFAGAGSGKTVLIRRTIEECALRGVSAIVLDLNNDLARLGEGWREPPEGWSADDRDLARQYLDHTDVVIWTPNLVSGRPLTFRPLPAFADLLGDDDTDELAQAVQAAADALAARANVNRSTAKHSQFRAVLREALQHFARQGGGGLTDFIALLGDLPDGVSRIGRARELARQLADMLHAARVNDPLFDGAGEPTDPTILFTPVDGKRARVSVISMIGLGSDEQRQGFVNQLQTTLFSWLKKHPAPGEGLAGLFVMDEAQSFAPASGTNLSAPSTLLLASQARKYGLGLIFATQSPRGLHNQISNNASTQFFGVLNSQTQITVARDLARAKGGDMPDLARLPQGHFYLGTTGRGFRKVRTPMCLSYHPPSPLSESEVLRRAREGR